MGIAEKAFDKLNVQFAGSVAAATKFEKSVDTLSSHVKSAATPTKELTKALKEVSKGFKAKKLSDQALTLSASMNIASRAFAGLRRAYTLILAPALKFEKAIAEISTLVDSAVTPNTELARTVRDLASEFGINAIDTARALYQTISAGAKAGRDANLRMEAAMQLAVGGITSAGRAAKVLNQILNAYNLKGDQAARVSDVLFTTMKGGITTIDEISRLIKGTAAAASLAGVSLEEMGAIISASTKVIGNTETAMTGMQAAVRGLVRPTEDVRKIAGNLGLNFDAAALASRGFVGVLEDLRSKGIQSQTVLARLFESQEAGRVVSALLADDLKSVNEQLVAQANNAGESAEATDKMTKIMDKEVEKATEAFDRLTGSIGELVTKNDGALEFVSNLGSNVDRLAKDIERANKAFGDGQQDLTDWVTKLVIGQQAFNELGEAGIAGVIKRTNAEVAKAVKAATKALRDLDKAKEAAARKEKAAIEKEGRAKLEASDAIEAAKEKAEQERDRIAKKRRRDAEAEAKAVVKDMTDAFKKGNVFDEDEGVRQVKAKEKLRDKALKEQEAEAKKAARKRQRELEAAAKFEIQVGTEIVNQQVAKRVAGFNFVKEAGLGLAAALTNADATSGERAAAAGKAATTAALNAAEAIILAHAAEAAAGAASSVAAIPVIGPLLIPGAVAAAFGLVKGLVSLIPSAAVGMEKIPGPPGQPFLFVGHGGERVQTRQEVDRSERRERRGGSGGGDLHVHTVIPDRLAIQKLERDRLRQARFDEDRRFGR